MDNEQQQPAPQTREEIPECEEWNGIKAENRTERVLLAYLRDNASESLAARIAAGKKTIRGAVSFVTNWARELAKGENAAMISSDEVFGQAIHYFEEDSLDAEKKAPAAKVEVGPGSKAAKKVRAEIKQRREAKKAEKAAAPKKTKGPKMPVQLTLDWLFAGTETPA